MVLRPPAITGRDLAGEHRLVDAATVVGSPVAMNPTQT